jgi:hemolysin D
MFGKNDDSHEFKPLLAEIESEPVNPLGRAIFWIIVIAIFFLGGWMYFGKVDVVVTARGKIIPVGEVKVLQPLTTGVVSNILAREGDLVEKGQVLMELDPSGTEPELTSMQEDSRLLELELLRLDAVLDHTSFQPQTERYGVGIVDVQQRLYKAIMARLQKQRQGKKEELQQVNEQLAAAEAEYKRIQDLLDVSVERLSGLAPVRDIISKDQYSRAESEVRSYQGSLIGAEHKCEELRVAARRVQSELEVIEEGERDKILSEIVEKRNKLNYLLANIEKTTYVNARQQLIAPVAGYVNKLFIHTIGGVVSPAEKVIALVPADSPLVVSALVQNKDIGFVSQGMEAGIKVDTFNFQKYGVLAGKVVHVAKDSIEDNNLGLVYEVYVEPQKTSLLVEGAYTPITTGMSVTTEIKVGRRRILEFFIYPLIKYLDEGISVR